MAEFEDFLSHSGQKVKSLQASMFLLRIVGIERVSHLASQAAKEAQLSIFKLLHGPLLRIVFKNDLVKFHALVPDEVKRSLLQFDSGPGSANQVIVRKLVCELEIQLLLTIQECE